MGALRPVKRVGIVGALLLTLLIPAGILAYQWRDMPHLGIWHDDAVYWISAKSLSTGGAYRLLNLAGAPPQTKYPPLYPLLLSAVWRVNPQFPGNAPLLMALQWSMLPVLVVLLWLWFRRTGFGPPIAFALTAVVTVCPMTTMFVTAPLTEAPFLIAVLTVMLLIGDETTLTGRRALAAGVCAAAAVLIRTNGIVLALSIPLGCIWRGRSPELRRGSTRHIGAMVLFLAPVLTAFAAWELWCARVRVPARSDILSYYTDYLGFYRHTFSLAGFPHRLWINSDGLLTSVTRLILWSTTDAAAYRQLCWAVSIFIFAGWVKLFRRGHRVPVLFAALFSLLLLIWNFPPDQRFVYPLLPFAAAGLAIQILKLMAKVRAEWRSLRTSNRIAAAIMTGAVATFLVTVTVLDAVAYRDTLPSWFASQRTRSADMRATCAWIARNTPSQAVVAAYDDPLLYLYTGRRSTSVAIMPALVYEGDDTALAAYVRDNVRQWTSGNVEYVLTTQYDFSREFQDVARRAELSQLKTQWAPLSVGDG